MGSSTNDVTALVVKGSKGFCDDSNKDWGTVVSGGVKTDQNLCDVIYKWPLLSILIDKFLDEKQL